MIRPFLALIEPPRDAVHAATMQNHGLDLLIGADDHFDVVEGTRRIDPATAVP